MCMLRFKTAQKLMNEYWATAYKPFGKKSKDLRDNPSFVYKGLTMLFL